MTVIFLSFLLLNSPAHADYRELASRCVRLIAYPFLYGQRLKDQYREKLQRYYHSYREESLRYESHFIYFDFPLEGIGRVMEPSGEAGPWYWVKDVNSPALGGSWVREFPTLSALNKEVRALNLLRHLGYPATEWTNSDKKLKIPHVQGFTFPELNNLYQRGLLSEKEYVALERRKIRELSAAMGECDEAMGIDYVYPQTAEDSVDFEDAVSLSGRNVLYDPFGDSFVIVGAY